MNYAKPEVVLIGSTEAIRNTAGSKLGVQFDNSPINTTYVTAPPAYEADE